MLRVFLLLVVCCGLADPAWAGHAVVPVRELGGHLGQPVEVQGRSGIIVRADEAGGRRVFTLRDDYGDATWVLPNGEFPILGVTYRLRGTPEQDTQTGRVVFREFSRQTVYSPWTPVLLALAIAVVSGVLVLIMVRAYLRKLKLPQEPLAAATPLPERWGIAEVMTGPQTGDQFDLRSDEVIIGRETGLDRERHVALKNLDMGVSNQHGVLVKRDEGVFFRDTDSTNGSLVNAVPAVRGEDVPIENGAMISLGPNTLLKIQLSAGDKAPAVGALPRYQTTMFPPEEPAQPVAGVGLEDYTRDLP